MKLLKFLFSKTFFKNILVMFVLGLILLFFIFKWLNVYTNHGEYVTLNDLSGLSLEQTIEILTEKKLNYVVIDSNTYRKEMENHSIISQEPLAMDKVKEGRTVYLYISTNKAPLVEIPFLKGNFSKEAGIMKLENLKFRIGEIIFKPSDSEGDILALMVDSIEVKEGQKAPEGTSIDLVVGGGLGGSNKACPCLIGLTLAEVEFKIGVAELNIGHIDYGNSKLIDTTNAVVYKQLPHQYEAIRIGEPVDLFFVQELPYGVNKCVNDTLN